MIKRILLICLLGFIFYSCKAQQVYECKNLGFKFVMDCECFDVLVKMGVNTTPYTMNIVPMITYILKGGPSEGKGFITGCKIFKINGESTFDKTGEEIITLLQKSNGGAVKLVLGLGFASGAVSEVDLYPKSGIEFPEPKYAPVEGGPKLLGSVSGPDKKTGNSSVYYENGDWWNGPVINKMYPDYLGYGGTYTSQEARMKVKYDEYAAYKKKMEPGSQPEAEAIPEQFKDDKLSTKQIITGFNSSLDGNPIICGGGIELMPYTEGYTRWFKISHIVPGSSAWFSGLDTGDVIVSVNGLNTKMLTKHEVIKQLTGKYGESATLEISQRDWGWFMNWKLEFLTPLNIPEHSSGMCISGDCTNGTGTWVDKAGNVSSGTFLNNVLNGTGTQYLADGSLAYKGNFVNGKKSGKATAQFGYGILKDKLITKTFDGEYLDDVPNGTATVNSFGIQTYKVEYNMGKIVSQQMTFANGDYCSCDPATLVVNKCYNKAGTEINYADAGIVKAVATYTPATQQQNNSGQKQYEGEYASQNLYSACVKFKDWGGGNCTWRDGGSNVFSSVRSNSTYATWTVPVIPRHSTVTVYVVMGDDEVGKVRYNYHDLSYYNTPYENSVLEGSGTIPELGLYYKTFTLINQYDDDVSWWVEVTGAESSHYYTRTVVWGYCTSGM